MAKDKANVLARRFAAQRIAKSEGRDWKQLSEDDRKARKEAARGQVTDLDRTQAAKRLSKRKLNRAEV